MNQVKIIIPLLLFFTMTPTFVLAESVHDSPEGTRKVFIQKEDTDSIITEKEWKEYQKKIRSCQTDNSHCPSLFVLDLIRKVFNSLEKNRCSCSKAGNRE